MDPGCKLENISVRYVALARGVQPLKQLRETHSMRRHGLQKFAFDFLDLFFVLDYLDQVLADQPLHVVLGFYGFVVGVEEVVIEVFTEQWVLVVFETLVE